MSAEWYRVRSCSAGFLLALICRFIFLRSSLSYWAILLLVTEVIKFLPGWASTWQTFFEILRLAGFSLVDGLKASRADRRIYDSRLGGEYFQSSLAFQHKLEVLTSWSLQGSHSHANTSLLMSSAQ